MTQQEDAAERYAKAQVAKSCQTYGHEDKGNGVCRWCRATIGTSTTEDENGGDVVGGTP